jgi:hypothetical protein
VSEKETAFRVTGRLSFDYQIIVQAKDSEEAAYFATDIDLDKWTESGSDWEVLDVSKNYFLKRVKVEQSESADDSALPSIVTESE